MRRERGHGVQMESRCGEAATQRKRKANHSRVPCKAASASRNCCFAVEAGLEASGEYTVRKTTSSPWEARYEIRHLLRAATAAPLGRGRRAPALPERADPTRDRRPARL